jgi:hypothetical protein
VWIASRKNITFHNNEWSSFGRPLHHFEQKQANCLLSLPVFLSKKGHPRLKHN